jgi:hypothetical protein
MSRGDGRIGRVPARRPLPSPRRALLPPERRQDLPAWPGNGEVRPQLVLIEVQAEHRQHRTASLQSRWPRRQQRANRVVPMRRRGWSVRSLWRRRRHRRDGILNAPVLAPSTAHQPASSGRLVLSAIGLSSFACGAIGLRVGATTLVTHSSPSNGASASLPIKPVAP